MTATSGVSPQYLHITENVFKDGVTSQVRTCTARRYICVRVGNAGWTHVLLVPSLPRPENFGHVTLVTGVRSGYHDCTPSGHHLTRQRCSEVVIKFAFFIANWKASLAWTNVMKEFLFCSTPPPRSIRCALCHTQCVPRAVFVAYIPLAFASILCCVLLPVQLISSSTLFQVEAAQSCVGAQLCWGQRIRLRHIGTGKFLRVRRSRANYKVWPLSGA